VLGSQRGGARPLGAAVVLRWLAWFNGAGRPGLVARAGVRSARQSVAHDSTTQRGRRAKRSRTACAATVARWLSGKRRRNNGRRGE
jgi:hypothetical protein